MRQLRSLPPPAALHRTPARRSFGRVVDLLVREGEMGTPVAGYLLAKKFEVLADGTLDAMLLNVFEVTREHVDPEWAARQRRARASRRCS